jgi:hypothetical protein
MTDIIVFGKEETATHPLMVIGEYSAQVLYISERSRKARPDRLLGYQPDLIVNLDKPDEELYMWQLKQSTYENAQVANLY